MIPSSVLLEECVSIRSNTIYIHSGWISWTECFAIQAHTSIYIRWKLLIVLGFYIPVYVFFVVKSSQNVIVSVEIGLKAQKDWESTFCILNYYALIEDEVNQYSKSCRRLYTYIHEFSHISSNHRFLWCCSCICCCEPLFLYFGIVPVSSLLL